MVHTPGIRNSPEVPKYLLQSYCCLLKGKSQISNAIDQVFYPLGTYGDTLKGFWKIELKDYFSTKILKLMMSDII